MKTYYNEKGYVELIQDVMNYGTEVPDRTGVGSVALFDAHMIFATYNNFPFSTIRPAPLRMAFEEFWKLFLTGETQTKVLEEKGIYFWKGNTTREFLDNRGLSYLDEGDMGKAYGYQFRNFGGKSLRNGVDQLQQVYENMKKDPYGRRHLVTFWNPLQSNEMALTPCWHSHQFVILPDENGEDRLNLKLINRSLDCIFGFSFAVQQYALYQMAMAKLLGIQVGALSCDLSQVHIYNNQLDYAKELVKRDFGVPGNIRINKELESLNDLINMEWDDIEIEGLVVNKEQFKTPKPDMAV